VTSITAASGQKKRMNDRWSSHAWSTPTRLADGLGLLGSPSGVILINPKEVGPRSVKTDSAIQDTMRFLFEDFA